MINNNLLRCLLIKIISSKKNNILSIKISNLLISSHKNHKLNISMINMGNYIKISHKIYITINNNYLSNQKKNSSKNATL
jgi:hypothetical protein